MLEPPLSDPVVLVFVVLPLLLLALFVWGAASASRRAGDSPATTRRLAIICLLTGVAWMALSWTIADSGALRDWNRRPPPLAILVLAIVVLGCVMAFSPLGRRLATALPLWTLVASQAFRLPLELAMHAMYERGVMPGQMSYSGNNFDIVTGTSAIAVAIAVRSGIGGKRLVALWNVVGLALLVNIVTVAILSTPLFAYFGSDRLNVWITYPPFVWLPAVMVLAALAGHLLIFRALSHGA